METIFIGMWICITVGGLFILYSLGSLIYELIGMIWFRCHKKDLIEGKELKRGLLYLIGMTWFRKNKNRLIGF